MWIWYNSMIMEYITQNYIIRNVLKFEMLFVHDIWKISSLFYFDDIYTVYMLFMLVSILSGLYSEVVMLLGFVCIKIWSWKYCSYINYTFFKSLFKPYFKSKNLIFKTHHVFILVSILSGLYSEVVIIMGFVCIEMWS